MKGKTVRDEEEKYNWQKIEDHPQENQINRQGMRMTEAEERNSVLRMFDTLYFRVQ